MAYWLLKSEPFKYSWARLVEDGRTHWDGVRNHQAAANLRAMKAGDRAFFYHSNEGKEIVGVVEVVREHFPDPTDKTAKFVAVDVKAVEPMPTPVTLMAIKNEAKLADMALVNQSRLSVQPVTAQEWKLVCAMGGLKGA
jgi:predicted RNA-binding protein with PUA-like domain